jgi:hypothetical protein
MFWNFEKKIEKKMFRLSQLETGWTDRVELKEWNNAPIDGNNFYARC